MTDSSQEDRTGNSGGDAAPDDMPMMQVTHDHLLNEAVKITQPSDGYRVGTDAVLLAAAVGTDSGRILDLGAGVGGVCLCLAHRLREVQITAVEKHGDLASLADENAEANGFGNRVRVLNTDIREMPPVLAASFDHVVSNPPYHNSHGTRPATTPARWRIWATIPRWRTGSAPPSGPPSRGRGSPSSAAPTGCRN